MRRPHLGCGRAPMSFRFSAVGARRFGDVTRENVGQPFAIVLDKEVIGTDHSGNPFWVATGLFQATSMSSRRRISHCSCRNGLYSRRTTVLEERTVGLKRAWTPSTRPANSLVYCRSFW